MAAHVAQKPPPSRSFLQQTYSALGGRSDVGKYREFDGERTNITLTLTRHHRCMDTCEPHTQSLTRRGSTVENVPLP